MKKLATLIGGIVCLSIMKQPKRTLPERIINNYYISKGCGCGGKCGGCKH